MPRSANTGSYGSSVSIFWMDAFPQWIAFPSRVVEFFFFAKCSPTLAVSRLSYALLRHQFFVLHFFNHKLLWTLFHMTVGIHMSSLGKCFSLFSKFINDVIELFFDVEFFWVLYRLLGHQPFSDVLCAKFSSLSVGYCFIWA